jgi:protein-L-isoaspartate(D-aspartate) O-methyltransferase
MMVDSDLKERIENLGSQTIYMTQQTLYSYLADNGAFSHKSIAQAFKKIDRGDFVPEPLHSQSYLDYPLPIGYGQTISQPSTVAFLMNALKPQKGDKILDVGSGSGWTTALLASIVGEEGRVIGVEIIPELVELGRNNLGKYNFPHATDLQAHDKILGWPEEAPFDRILVSATTQTVPQELIDQLKIGGRMVIPIGNAIWTIDRLSETVINEHVSPGYIFVPLRH